LYSEARSSFSALEFFGGGLGGWGVCFLGPMVVVALLGWVCSGDYGMVWYGTVWMGGLEGEGDWGLRGRARLLILYIVLCLVFLFFDGRCCELSGVGVVVACTIDWGGTKRCGRIRRLPCLECGVDGRKWRKLEDALLPPSSILRQALALRYPCLLNSFIPALGLFLEV
jgi:hypothetical protein